ncbi:methyltransferase domain-containing protein [Salinisphaera sp. T31B1]|uniref:class I SAM-dependent methyltransferase n=1 Tax=Salinisphaera sp. T31B1 TaxID=727963 RepID=UPI0033410E92
MSSAGPEAPTADTTGGWNADDYAANARFVADLAGSLVDWLEPAAGERILDLGCGDGELGLAIAARGAHVLGVDASPAFVAAAGRRGLTAVVGDGQALDRVDGVDGRFDAVFSNAALHWMNRAPDAVIQGVFDRLVPGGRFVAEFGAQGNCGPIRQALRAELQARGLDADAVDPWFFPSEADYLARLRAAGFVVEAHECFERPTPLPGDITAWIETLARPFVHAVEPDDARPGYVAAVRERLAPMLRGEDGRWTAPYVRLRFRARRPVMSDD